MCSTMYYYQYAKVVGSVFNINDARLMWHYIIIKTQQMAMHKMIGRMEELPSNRPSSFMHVDGIFDARISCGVVVMLGWECFPACAENEQGLVAWEPASHLYPAVGHGMPTSLPFFLTSHTLMHSRGVCERSKLLVIERNKISKRGVA